MATVTTTFDDLIDETFSVLYRHTERPRETRVAATALDSASDTTFTVTDPDEIAATTLLEFADGEQVRVLSKSDTDLITVERGYNATTASGAQPTNTLVTIGPVFGRNEVERWVKRFFSVHGNRYFPYLETSTKYRNTGEQVVELPADTIDVVEVRAQSADTGRIADIGGWKFEQRVPVSIYSTGKVLRVPSTIADDDELWVTRQAPWDVSGDTVGIPVGAEDLPVLFAAAYAVGRREVSRLDLDSIQEWNQASAIRNGQNIRLMRELWGEFYRRLDEARSLYHMPRHRPYEKMPRIR